MRYALVFVWLLCALPASAQSGENPFELTDRLPAAARAEIVPDSNENPFDIYPELALAPEREAAAPPILVETKAEQGVEASIIFVHLILLLFLASLWVLFRNLIRQCSRAIFNDNIMTQLYRRRSGGQISALWMCYLFFLLSAGFFLYLFAAEYGFGAGGDVWSSWLTFTMVVMAAVGFKLFLLMLIGRIYPLRKELSRYIFLLMVFSILAGILLVPLNLLISYAPGAYRHWFVVGGLGLLGLVYLLHLVRGLFIANHHVGRRPLHFLLYICTIEVAPLLLVYRYLSNTLA